MAAAARGNEHFLAANNFYGVRNGDSVSLGKAFTGLSEGFLGRLLPGMY